MIKKCERCRANLWRDNPPVYFSDDRLAISAKAGDKIDCHEFYLCSDCAFQACAKPAVRELLIDGFYRTINGFQNKREIKDKGKTP